MAKNKQISDKNQAELGSLNNKMEEYLAGNLVIKTFNQQGSGHRSRYARSIKRTIKPLKSTIYEFLRFIQSFV